ncbi:hypothetical protein CP975_19065 [Streptomyces alboniger]|uniref:Uncharacterized protein n=1 Tax=Streptomyces alboniger TaxID=132473 RepID=A0A5J6HLI8_STRAD|nr:hypothetical protein CP975_19065 [Streptomyces alboniger]
MVQVKAHMRGGVPVRAHTRSHPGSGRQLTIAAIVALLVWGASEGGIKFEGEVKTLPPHRSPSTAPVQPGGVR